MKYRHRVLGLLFMASLITYLDRVCISVAGPAIQADLGLSLKEWSWVLGIFVVSYGAFEIPMGAMGDRIGPRRVLARIVLWWSAFTALTGASQGFRQLLVVRFLFGAGEAGAFPNFSAAIARWFPGSERARAQSVVWMGSRLGGALAPLVVIPLIHTVGWRNMFYIFGAIGAIWAVLWYAWFRDSPVEKPGISDAELSEIQAGSTATTQEPTPWRRMFRQTNLWWIMLMYHSNAWCGFFYLTWMHVFLVKGRDFSPAELMWLSWVPFAVGAMANLAGGLLSDTLVQRLGLRWGRRAVGFGGFALAACFLAATAITQDKYLTLALLALAYGFSDLALPVAWAVCLDVGRENVGVVAGSMNMAAQLGSFLTTMLFGYIVAETGNYNLPLIPIAIMSAVGAFAWLMIDAARPVVGELPNGVS